MPIGIVSDDEFEKELDNSSVVIDSVGVPSIGRKEYNPDNFDPNEPDPLEIISGEIEGIKAGRGEGNNEVPESLRNLLGETSILEGRSTAIELAKEFGISHQSVDAYTKGATSLKTFNNPDKKLKNHLDIIRRNASKRAGRKLLAALDHITEDKLEEAPAGVLASVAKSLSGVIRDLEPEVIPVASESGVKFVVFAPQIVQESKYETIQVNE